MKRVLIVDDAAFMRFTIKAMLEKNGNYEVVGEAENGQIGVEKYKELMPDVVTMDITMPELDGIGAVKKIKSLNPKANVLMVSAMGQEKLVKDSIIAGAKGFIVKPFKEDKLIEALEKL
jgi:two-component system chemotaxis response regulator CheY